jgi:hypothetical protein
MIVLIDAEKVFDKIQHAFMIRALKNLGIKGIFHNIINKPRDNTILNGEQLKPFLLKLGMRQGCPLSTPLFNIVLEFLATAVRHQQEIKGIKIGEEEIKLPLFEDNMILYLRDPKNATKIFEIINSLSKLAA